MKLINDKQLETEIRDAQLRETASEAWGALFPEDRRRDEPRLSSDVRHERWQLVIAQLNSYPEKKKILRVLESSASGERFYWLD